MPSSHCLIPSAKRVWLITVVLIIIFASLPPAVNAQDTVTGAFEGTVSHSQTRERIAGALVQIINRVSDVTLTRRADAQGRFYQGLLPPGVYAIRVSAPGFKTTEKEQLLITTAPNQVVPIPILLEPETAASAPTSSTALTQPNAPASSPPSAPYIESSIEDRDAVAEINRTDGRRSGAFTDYEVVALPLGGVTLVRTFDELALLLPGVALPPQTLGVGGVSGPGVGPGIGTSGQFAVNGLRSRANNFTVDGSDNNDDDIGVRRQGFLALIPQPLESIKEFQLLTLLAPAQYGRNIGAQVNAVSHSGGNGTHGTLFGLFNSSQLNARNFFDTTGGNTVSRVRSASGQGVTLIDASGTLRRLFVRNDAGEEDSFTLGQGGFAFGGPLVPETAEQPGKSMFYFVSAEGQLLNASQEVNFAVPTVEQRGFLGTGASGIFQNPFTGAPVPSLPSNATTGGAAVLSLFPFSNNPRGIYGANTLTQQLPAGGQGKVLSGKVDANFKLLQRQQRLTARYNFTDDFRDIPATGGALFSTLRSRVRTQNFSTFLNSELSGLDSTRPIFNQVRASYGRTRLVFDQRRDEGFLVPSELLPDEPFLLNAPMLLSVVLAAGEGRVRLPNTGTVFLFENFPGLQRTEQVLGPVGQINIAGFSPVGVDVFNFPQRRVNNTYQLADTLTVRGGSHNLAFGTDVRRSELNSDVPRNSRPLITFNGAPRFTADYTFNQVALAGFTNLRFSGQFINPVDLAAASAPSGVFQTLALGDSDINLRYYQLNFFAQDEWRIRPRLSLSYGLRYEYNTPPSEVNQRIESTFDDPSLDLIPGLRSFLGGRTQIFEPDRNNFAPRVGLAYSPDLFGVERATVLRAGFGVYYDQVLGAVVSQSRNVFPSFLTINTAGGARFSTGIFDLASLYCFDLTDTRLGDSFCGENNRHPLIQRATLNRVNPQLSLPDVARLVNCYLSIGVLGSSNVSRDLRECFNNANFLANSTVPSGFGFTLPARELQMPEAYHYSLTFEQQLSRDMVVSAAYVGTQGRRLLRPTTPNLGPNAVLVPIGVTIFDNAFFTPQEGASPSNRPAQFYGLTLQPGTSLRITPQGVVTFAGERPRRGVGAVNIYETSANSRYDALQVQLRGRLRNSVQYQSSYTFSRATDDVSDVFDLAGASALPQNSVTGAGERGPANFDARHRLIYQVIYDLPRLRDRSAALRLLLGGLQIASTGLFQTGQPFTVNSIFDVNLDGNLTDRLNSTEGIVVTGDRRQPLLLTTGNTLGLLAPLGEDGKVGRNTFRAGNILELNLAVTKSFAVTDEQRLILRADVFNFINRANYGIPVRFLEAPGFGQATNTVTPARRIQFALKYSF